VGQFNFAVLMQNKALQVARKRPPTDCVAGGLRPKY